MTRPTHKGGAGSRKTQAKTVVVATACSVAHTGANDALTSGPGCRIQASLHKAKCGATRCTVAAAACKAGAQRDAKRRWGHLSAPTAALQERFRLPANRSIYRGVQHCRQHTRRRVRLAPLVPAAAQHSGAPCSRQRASLRCPYRPVASTTHRHTQPSCSTQ